MRIELILRVPGEPEAIREGLRLYLLGEGYRERPRSEEEHEASLRFVRGSSWKRIISMSTESWPTELRVTLVPSEPNDVLLLLRYDVGSRWHLVGALDDAVLEAEAACLEDYLLTGERRRVSEAVRPLRGPVMTAAFVNMILSALIIVWIGHMGGFPKTLVAGIACLVAFLDGIVILAFADLLVEGSRRVPRLAARPRPRSPWDRS